MNTTAHFRASWPQVNQSKEQKKQAVQAKIEQASQRRESLEAARVKSAKAHNVHAQLVKQKAGPDFG